MVNAFKITIIILSALISSLIIASSLSKDNIKHEIYPIVPSTYIRSVRIYTILA
jgi:hypothetical protein